MKRIILAVVGLIVVSIAGVFVKGMLTSESVESTESDEPTSDTTSEN